jgi:6-phosphogluconate dehydrogenase
VLSKRWCARIDSFTDLVNKLKSARVIWLIVTVASVDETISKLVPYLDADDILIDGGNSY